MTGYKSAVTQRINAKRGTPGKRVWLRNYWEHVVRNDKELSNIRSYIQNNPAQWEFDQLNIHRTNLPGTFQQQGQVGETLAEYKTKIGMVQNGI